VPCAPYLVPFGRGENGHEKTPSVAGGVLGFSAMRLTQRARPPDTPPAGVVVVAEIRPKALIGGNIATRLPRVKTGAGSRQRGSDIGLGEIVALEQQRLSSAPRQRVGEAVAEIQSRPMSAAPAEIAVGFASHVRLNFIQRLDDDARLAQQIIKAPADDRITPSIDHGSGLNVTYCRNPSFPGSSNSSGINRRIAFGKHDRHQRR
jgi:hypothetical protein